jgi:hypothetical protein
MTYPRIFAPFAALFALLTVSASVADAYTVPNLVALSSPDQQVAIAYAASPDRTTLEHAGAFATTMTQQYGMIAIPNYDPTSLAGSILVCEAPLNPDELVVVYGIEGQGVFEAGFVCQALSDTGVYVRWR